MKQKKEVDGGCILLARQTLLSEIWNKPPAYFKIFFYILAKVNHTNTKSFPRGTGLFNFKQIQIPGVTRYQIYEFLRWAKTLSSTDSPTLITTQKTTRGIIVKVNNYNIYQDWETYYPQHRNQHEKQHTPNTISINNKDIYSNNIYNISSSSTQKSENKIDDDEREILKNYVKRNKLAKTNLRGYVKKIIDNGDYLDILKEEKERLAKLELIKQQSEINISPEKIEKEDEKITRETMKRARAKVLQALKGEKND